MSTRSKFKRWLAYQLEHHTERTIWAVILFLVFIIGGLGPLIMGIIFLMFMKNIEDQEKPFEETVKPNRR